MPFELPRSGLPPDLPPDLPPVLPTNLPPDLLPVLPLVLPLSSAFHFPSLRKRASLFGALPEALEVVAERVPRLALEGLRLAGGAGDFLSLDFEGDFESLSLLSLFPSLAFEVSSSSLTSSSFSYLESSSSLSSPRARFLRITFSSCSFLRFSLSSRLPLSVSSCFLTYAGERFPCS